MSTPRKQVLLRLPPQLKRNVQRLAKKNGKSMTREIQHALEQHTRSFGPTRAEVR
jgi:predicted DNA-binding protein